MARRASGSSQRSGVVAVIGVVVALTAMACTPPPSPGPGGGTNMAPTVAAGVDVASGTVPLTVQFDADATDSDGSVVSVSWDFGDGSTSQQAGPTHTYEAVGTFTATVTAMDDQGATGSDSLQVEVRPVDDPGSYAYVAMTNLGAIKKIDTATLETVGTLAVDGPIGESIALSDGRIFYSEDKDRADVGVYDLTTGENDRTYLPESVYGAVLATSPVLPGILFVAASSSPLHISKWDVSGPVPVKLAESVHGEIGGFIRDYEISADGSRIWVACGSPYEITEVRTSDLRASGRRYPTGAYPQAVDSIVTPEGELMAAGRSTSTADSSQAFVFDAVNPAVVTSHDVNRTNAGDGGVERRDIGFSRDGALVYSVVEGWYNSSMVTIDRATGGVTRAPLFDDSDTNGIYYRNGELAVDPGTGRVFVSAVDRIAVYNPDGSFGRMLVEPGPRGIAFTATGPTSEPPPLTTTTTTTTSTTTTSSTTTTTTAGGAGPPIISAFGATRNDGSAPLTTGFSWAISDPDHDQLTCELDFDDDGSYEVTEHSCTSASKRSSTFWEGTHVVHLRVSDGSSSVVATSTVWVAPSTSDTFDITVRSNGGLSASQRAAFDGAGARWSEVIRSGLPDVSLELAVDDCAAGTPAFSGTVDDLLIDAAGGPIDGPGGVLAQAGPCLVRTGSNLPAYGVMLFDSADLPELELSGQLEDVIRHEMGHVLGIGTVWGSLLTGAGTQDPVFTGVAARGAWDSLLGGSGISVPVENSGGVGTADAHWRESVFGSELMTGYLDPGTNPLSVVTVGSLSDIGYGVDLAAADPFGSSESMRPSGPARKIETDLIFPKGTVGG